LVYLDPPYNCGYSIGSFSDHLDDKADRQWFQEVLGCDGDGMTQEERWLTALYGRLLLVRELLSETGTIAVSIDYCEFAPLSVLIDELFEGLPNGRVFTRKHSFETNAVAVSSRPNYLIIRSGACAIPDLHVEDWSSTADARRELCSELGCDVDEYTPKPRSLLQYLVREFTGPEGSVLDPYAGSGTSAYALSAVNKADGGRRRVVMIERDARNVRLIIERLARLSLRTTPPIGIGLPPRC
jgi:DNA modification methylase